MPFRRGAVRGRRRTRQNESRSTGCRANAGGGAAGGPAGTASDRTLFPIIQPSEYAPTSGSPIASLIKNRLDFNKLHSALVDGCRRARPTCCTKHTLRHSARLFRDQRYPLRRKSWHTCVGFLEATSSCCSSLTWPGRIAGPFSWPRRPGPDQMAPPVRRPTAACRAAAGTLLQGGQPAGRPLPEGRDDCAVLRGRKVRAPWRHGAG